MREDYSVFRIPASEEETVLAEVGMPRLGMPGVLAPRATRPAISFDFAEVVSEDIVPEGSLAVYKELNAIAEEIEKCRSRVWMR